MSEQFNIDDFLRNELDAFELEPRITSFDAVQKKLQKKKKRRALYLLFFGIGIAVISSLSYMLFQPKFSGPPKETAMLPTSSKQVMKVNSTPETNENQIAEAKQKEKALRTVTSNPQQHTPQLPTTTRLRMQANDKPVKHFAQVQNNNYTKSTWSGENIVSTNNTVEQTASIVAVPMNTVDSSTTSGNDSIVSQSNADSAIFQQNTIHQLAPTLSELKPMLSDSLIKAKQKIKFLLGIYLQPQYSSLLITEAKNTQPGSFEQMYFSARKEQLAVNLNYALGLTAGYRLNTKWELWCKAGYQNLHYYEKPSVLSPLTINGSASLGASVQYAGNTKNTELGYKNEFSYSNFSITASRLFSPNPFVQLVMDVGINTNYLVKVKSLYIAPGSTYEYTTTTKGSVFSRWACNAYFNFGIIKDLSSKMQARIVPGVFASPTSMFKKDYVLQQRPYGLALECTLVYKFVGKENN